MLKLGPHNYSIHARKWWFFSGKTKVELKDGQKLEFDLPLSFDLVSVLLIPIFIGAVGVGIILGKLIAKKFN